MIDYDKWYLLSWRDDAPYKISNVFVKLHEPDDMLLAMTDPYGKESMLAVHKDDIDGMKEFKRPETDGKSRLSTDNALSAYGYCARYVDEEDLLYKKDGTSTEKDYERTKDQHMRYRRAVMSGWNVPSWQAWKTLVCC